MKNKILLAFTMLITLSKYFGQLEMSSNGNVGVGNIPLSSYKLNIYGDTYFRPFGSESRIIIDQYEEEALIGTTDNIYGYIGTPNKQFWKIYSRYVYSNGVLLTSDKRKKENIKSLNSKHCLEKITKIKSREYNFKQNIGLSTKKSTTKKKLDLHKKEFGFLAQDLQNIIPEVVEYDLKNDDYYVNYTAIIPLLVESIKEQQKTIQKLNRKINNLKEEVSNNESLTNIPKNKNSLG
ncbi:tail fiber domain-containing protein [Tenacibaculum finnmarkense genomovar ulcerans]|uniref:tail fiber domain-containing protein n=1 Tax=Tenacibaculum finnmarkense TaxID=2781243 RepID=UPI001E36C99F|nr:tail fiber domain-containing protein [Tenacibaculum finnmarkense]MCD8455229.1 tail fiber domain-containing protein [Tenacibaculum finnmarkense genomovar ulcerans]